MAVLLSSAAAPFPHHHPTVFQDIARWAARSARLAFCSTRKMVCGVPVDGLMISKICLVTSGAGHGGFVELSNSGAGP
jgi:hypothetical protein